VAALIGVVVAVVLHTRASSPKATLVSPPKHVNVTKPAPALPTITNPQMALILQRYAVAYSSENVAALRKLFAAGLVRKNGTDPAESLSQALTTYRGQFANLTNPKYSLSNVAYHPAQAVATATYSIKSGSGTARGTIVYHFVRVGNRVLIDTLTIRSS